MLTSIFHDLRYSFRTLLKHRTFTAAAILTLALGIGINTSIFTLLYSLAFRPLPVKDPDRVVNVYQILDGEFSRQVEGNVAMLSYPEYLNYRDKVAGRWRSGRLRRYKTLSRRQQRRKNRNPHGY